MKLFILQEKLKKGLQIVEKIATKSLTLPILNNVLIQAKKNFLTLSTTDLEIGIRWWGLARIEKEGELTAPLSLFSNFLGLLPNRQITIEKKGEFLEIECANHLAKIKGLPPEDFPIIPEVSKESFIEMENSLLCQGLEHIVEIAAPSQSRPEISGILFSLEKDVVRMAATDSFRLGEKSISTNFNQEISFIVPQKTAKEIIHIFGQKKGKVRIYFAPNQILLESQMTETQHPEVQLVSRLIDGEYPAYQEIIPKKHDTQAVLPKNEFLDNLKTAALFGGKINEIRLKIDSKKRGVEFFSQNPDLGEHTSFLTGEIKGEGLEVSFNHRFLVSGLLNIKSPQVVFELSKEEGPAVLKPLGDPSYLYVVMPIKAS